MNTSVDLVLRDKKRYKVLENKSINGWPAACQITVQDLTDGSLWCKVYATYDDDAETHHLTEWDRAVKVTVETYKSVRELK